VDAGVLVRWFAAALVALSLYMIATAITSLVA
jgi:hypothetical protein